VPALALVAGLVIVGGQASATAAPNACTGVSTWTDLAAGFGAGGTVTLCTNITASSGQYLAVGSTPVTLDLNGFDLTITDPGSDSAAIDVTSGHTLSITDTSTGAPGTLTATGGQFGAGIGGGSSGADGGTLTIQGSATVRATGGFGGAGIGGGDDGNGGTVTVQGNATVTAAGGFQAAGIGGGLGGDGRTVSIQGHATVTATGGHSAAGIGGGASSDAGTVTIQGNATVTATGDFGGAGIGGGWVGDGGTVTIEQGATVTAAGDEASAIGAGSSGTSFGSLSNAGTLIIPSGVELDVPSGVTVANSGSLKGAGTVANHGAITLGAHGTVASTLTVTDHNYLLEFTTTAGSVSPTKLHVYAATVTDSGQSLPMPSGLSAGDTFVAWHDNSGTAADAATDLTAYGGATANTNPVPVGLHAFFAQSITFTSTPPDPATPTRTYTVVATGGSSGNAVEFAVAPSSVCTITGTAVTFSTAGTCTITATQAGSTDFAKATATQKITVEKKTTTVTVTGPDQATVGSPVQFEVTVAGDPPSGTITLTTGSITLGSATLDPDGTASITTSKLPPGTDIVTANYSGDTTFAKATGTATITVTASRTTTTPGSTIATPTPSATTSAGTLPLANTGVDSASGLGLAGILLAAGFGLLLAGFGWQRRHKH
jgi:LPXTG-motif cell wall-anchored protein